MEAPSVAVVVLDTVRKDAFDRYFGWVPGVRFERAYSTSHWTVPAHASMLTGRYASEVGVHGKSRSLDCPEETLVETLQAAGYATRLWTANLQIHAWEGWCRGFDEVLGPEELRVGAERSVSWAAFKAQTDVTGVSRYAKGIWHALTAPESTIASLREGYRLFRDGPGERGAAQLLERVRGTAFGDREFLLVNLMEVHTPHHPPAPYRTYDDLVDFKIGDAFAGLIDDPDRNRRAYDDSAAYLSAVYRELFDELSGSFDLIVTLSDHGELLGEYGLWNHGYGIYPELARVPLVVWRRGADDPPDGVVRDDVASLLDLPATIAGATGATYESRGRDLLASTEAGPRLVEYHGFLPWHREQFERKGIPEVYEPRDSPLNGLVRPDGSYVFETHDSGLLAARGEPTAVDEDALADLVSTLSKRPVADDEAAVSPAVRRRLEDLGYA